jgi:hypothetical protein
MRNQEIHTGELPFEDLKPSEWLRRYYEVVDILCESLGHTLNDFLGPEVAASAEKLIASLNKEQESAVKSTIAAHAKVFNTKPEEEQKKLRARADLISHVEIPASIPQTSLLCI